jgi:predicted glycoside hydrolase/deacetylase ChbG (UPF0249 family)
MKKKLTNQEIIIEQILEDLGRIPNFIDPKKHLEIWRSIQSIYYSIMRLTASRFLSIQDLIAIDEEIGNDLFAIEEKVNTAFYSLVVVFINKKLKQYFEMAEYLELYECASNIKNYNERI